MPNQVNQTTAILASARASAVLLCQGPGSAFRPGWFPKLGRQIVRNTDDPPLGYATREKARTAAVRYRALCKGIANA